MLGLHSALLLFAATQAEGGPASAPPPPPVDDPNAGENMANPGASDGEIGTVPAPAPPTDHAADALYGPEKMAKARAAMFRDAGAATFYGVQFDLAEYRVQRGRDAIRWVGEGRYGGDINQLVVKTEGEAIRGRGVEAGEVQGLYARAIDPYFTLQAGIRHDFRPRMPRTYATLGVEGIAPYWFKLEGALFLSTHGDLLARAEASYDLRVTQKLILQPRAELNFSAQKVRATQTGSGLSEAELGLRLRYEIRHEFAPYVGVSFEGKTGSSARLARLAGDRVRATSLVAGIRFGF